MSDIWRGTYAAIPASVRMVGMYPCAFLAGRLVLGEDERGIFRNALHELGLSLMALPDPRPAAPAQLAAEVAKELRQTHGIRAMVDGKCGVSIGGYYYDMVCKEHWTPLGPIAIAAEIKKLECARAMQDAGDV